MQTFKATLRIPTPEQYAFVEVTLEGTTEQIHAAYSELTASFFLKEGLSEKDFNQFLDNQALNNGKNHIETYNLMSEMQKTIVQTNKKMYARLKNKQEA